MEGKKQVMHNLRQELSAREKANIKAFKVLTMWRGEARISASRALWVDIMSGSWYGGQFVRSLWATVRTYTVTVYEMGSYRKHTQCLLQGLYTCTQFFWGAHQCRKAPSSQDRPHLVTKEGLTQNAPTANSCSRDPHYVDGGLVIVHLLPISASSLFLQEH